MKAEIQKKETKKLKCSNCKSSLVYLRIKTKTLVCRTCGFETKLS